MKAPKSAAYGRDNILPKEIEDLPLPTIVVRQHGQAWSRPFVAIYESAATDRPRSIRSTSSFAPKGAGDAFVGIRVLTVAGRHEYLFSNPDGLLVQHQDMSAQADYAVVSCQGNELASLLLGHGRQVYKGGYSLIAKAEATTAALVKQVDGWHLASDRPIALTVAGKSYRALRLNGVRYNGKKMKIDEQAVTRFELPATPNAKLELQ